MEYLSYLHIITYVAYIQYSVLIFDNVWSIKIREE